MSDYETIEVEFDKQSEDYLNEVARLARMDVNAVVTVILAMECVRLANERNTPDDHGGSVPDSGGECDE